LEGWKVGNKLGMEIGQQVFGKFKNKAGNKLGMEIG
jgi:hypothetical protein